MSLVTNSWISLFVALFLVSCAEVKSSKYQDTSHLEMPPEMEIVETAPKVMASKQDKKEVTGLGGLVSLAGSDEKPVLKIKKLFDRSWNIVEQAIKLNEIKITDKNREDGVFYLDFAPDADNSNESGLIDAMSFFLFKDGFEEASYKLTVIWRESDTEVTAELVDQESSDLLDDDEDDFDSSVDTGALLVNALYKTIRDDLPVN